MEKDDENSYDKSSYKEINDKIKNNNLKELKNYININSINLKEWSIIKNNFLLEAIKNNCSYELIEYILNQCQYKNLNNIYEINITNTSTNINNNNNLIKKGNFKSPLYFSIEKNNFEVSNLLIENKADINYDSRIIRCLLKNDKLNKRNLKFILNKNFDLEKNDMFDYLIKKLKNKRDLLGIIIKYYMYSNSFILCLLVLYKNKDPISKEAFQCVIQNNKHQNTLINLIFHVIDYESRYLSNSLFNYLIDQGVDINSRDNNGKSALIHAIEKNNNKIVKCLLNHGTDINRKDNKGKTPLIYAIEKENNKIVKHLLDHGAEIDSKDNEGKTPLMYAMERHNDNVVEYLLNLEAKINITNENKQLLVNYIMDNNCRKIFDNNNDIQFINNNIEIIKPLFLDINYYYLNKFNILKILVQNDLDINSKDNKGKTLLFFAVEENNIEMAKYLIDKKGEINTRDNEGKTPLMYAIENNEDNLIKYLLDHGAEIDNKNYKSKSLLTCATVEKNN